MTIIAEATEYDIEISEAEELMEKEDYRGAIQKIKVVLEQLEPHLPTIAQAAVLQGRCIVTEIMNTMEKTGEEPSMEDVEKAWESYSLSEQLDPSCEESNRELLKLSNFIKVLSTREKATPVKADYDVLVVGAGASGVGTTLLLTEVFGLDRSRVVVVERGSQVGESFCRWPEEMRFISPSFNQQGWTKSYDLNAVYHGTSPAFSLHTQHPSGKEYAKYLEALAEMHEMNVKTQTEVVSLKDISVEVDGEEGEKEKTPLFSVNLKSLAGDNGEEMNSGETEETVTARYIVWAAGEFQYPKGASSSDESKTKDEKTNAVDEDEDFPGANLCMHNSTVQSWAKLPGDEYIIIGGYESGVDAAVNLSRAGKKCKVLASTPCWNVKTTDPSAELAPYTASRLRDVLAPGFSPHPQLYAPLRVKSVEKVDEGYRVTAEWMEEEEELETPNLRTLVNRDVKEESQGQEGSSLVLLTSNPPVLATGFVGSVKAAASHLFDFVGEDDEKKGCLAGAPLLTQNDESSKVPGVFLVGPTVSHGDLSFCFVYKYRQRFGIVANAICEGLGIDTRAAVRICREQEMFMDDFSCCGDTCGDVC